MVKKISSPIVSYQVVTANTPGDNPEPPNSNVIQMHERLERPDTLVGETYKVKTPVSDHALYITINDLVLNEGTEHQGDDAG